MAAAHSHLITLVQSQFGAAAARPRGVNGNALAGNPALAERCLR
jgi:hypothetical protein